MTPRLSTAAIALTGLMACSSPQENAQPTPKRASEATNSALQVAAEDFDLARADYLSANRTVDQDKFDDAKEAAQTAAQAAYDALMADPWVANGHCVDINWTYEASNGNLDRSTQVWILDEGGDATKRNAHVVRYNDTDGTVRWGHTRRSTQKPECGKVSGRLGGALYDLSDR